MKKRGSFHKIIVEGKTFQYSWTWPFYPNSSVLYLVVYDQKDTRYFFKIPRKDIPDGPRPTWFGKHTRSGRGARCIGMWQANYFITKLIREKNNGLV